MIQQWLGLTLPFKVLCIVRRLRIDLTAIARENVMCVGLGSWIGRSVTAGRAAPPRAPYVARPSIGSSRVAWQHAARAAVSAGKLVAQAPTRLVRICGENTCIIPASATQRAGPCRKKCLGLFFGRERAHSRSAVIALACYELKQ
jgi:hypothetical protein